MIRKDITDFIDSYLQINEIEDFSYNGLQFEASEEIRRIGFAVDAGIGTFTQAAEQNIDMLVVHHGLFWKKQNPVITGVHKKRLNILFENQINLYAAHLPLDLHDEVGNNAGLLKYLSVDLSDRFSAYGRFQIGAIGEFGSPRSIDSIITELEEKLCSGMKLLKVSDKPVHKVAVMSGACNRGDLYDVASKGVDLLITGEPMELYHDAHDYGVSVIFAGHHASETVGVSLLKEKISQQFPSLETVFLDHPTGL